MVGAHLDSEPDTAGINDNGSGSAGILEVALQMREVQDEEQGAVRVVGRRGVQPVGLDVLRGQPASEEELAKIALYLNFDMIGSPNYTFGVYDGDDSAAEGSGPGPAGSAQIEEVFQDVLRRRAARRPSAADFTGRSDYGPFIAAGVDIPAGGLFTGAEVQKTEADVALWGGVAGAQYDPCYHAPCDSLTPERNGADAALYAQLRAEYRLFGNVNTFAIDTNADAIATAVATFAYDTSSIPPRTPAPAAARMAAPAAAAQTAQGLLQG